MTQLSRRGFLAGAAATAALAGLSGCSNSSVDTDVVTSASRLNVLNWPLYINEDLIDTVAGQLNQQINYKASWTDNYNGAEEFGPSWDIVTPTNWLAAQYIQDGSVQRLPVELIPNHKNIDPAFLTNGWDRGARFHMPWQSGITGIAYDPALTGRKLTSIDDLFADDLRGRVAMIGEMREAVGLVMLRNGADPVRPTLGEARAAFDQLAEANERGQFHSWVFEDFAELLTMGEVAASMAWSGDAVALQRERPDIEFLIPEQGAIQWFDTMVIPTGAANARGAALWMNAFYDPAIAALNTQAVQYISPVLGVEEELVKLGGEAAELAANPILFPDDEVRRRLFIWGGLDSFEQETELDGDFAAMAGLA